MIDKKVIAESSENKIVEKVKIEQVNNPVEKSRGHAVRPTPKK